MSLRSGRIELTWLEPQSDPTSAGRVLEWPRIRRAHAKSRSGCGVCKRRRKKCDESRPTCGQCERYGAPCDFTLNQSSRTPGLALSGGLSQYVMSRKSARSELHELLGSAPNPRPPTKSKVFTPDVLELLDHFLDCDTVWMGSPQNQKTLQTFGVTLGVQAPYLLHAIVAFSSSHKYFLTADAKYKAAVAYHYDKGLAAYAAQLGSINAENIDHLYGTCNLLVMLAFFNNDVDTLDHTIDTRDHDCDWNAFKTLQGGRVLELVPQFRERLSQGVWLPVLQESGQLDEMEWKVITVSERTHLSDKIEELRVYCGVSATESSLESPYFEPIKRMNNIAQSGLDYTTINRVFSLISQLSPAFINLLEHFDQKAMLILCYCFAVLLQVPQWWTVMTARHACRRMTAYLYLNGDDKLRHILQFPVIESGLSLEAIGV